MPYIPADKRPDLTPVATRYADNAGELNYQITCLIKEYLKGMGKSYQTLNDIMGALEGAKLELYRRLAAPYEDQKIKDHGDVYK